MEEKGTAVYIAVLTDTLKKKSKLLESLRTCSSRQSILLDEDPVDVDAFEKEMEAKDIMLKELESIDSGFESVYRRVNEALKGNKAVYKQEIKIMQEIIRQIAACSADVQVLEEKNKNKFQNFLIVQRNTIKISLQGRQTAGAYYKNMSDQHQNGQSYFFNKKN